MKKCISNVVFGILFLVPTAAFCKCPDWFSQKSVDLPVCPDGAGIPETYPTAAVVVSDIGGEDDLDDDDNDIDIDDSLFTVEFVSKVLLNAGDRTPLIVLPASGYTVDKIRAGIHAMSVSPAIKEKYLNSLLPLKTRSYTWQQDYFQSFIDPKTGVPVLRLVDGYDTPDQARGTLYAFNKIVEATKECGFQLGDPLVTARGRVNGSEGGNIQILPAGICALGDDHFLSDTAWSGFADQFCGKDPGDRIKVPTSWLDLGHADEIMKVIRDHRRKAPCDFSIVLASPQKALDLLKKHPAEKFLQLVSRDSTDLQKVAEHRLRRGEDGLPTLCRAYTDMKTKQKSDKWATHAERAACANLRNSDVVDVFNANADLRTYNELIQTTMTQLRGQIETKLKAKLPACEIDFLDVPDLFIGGTPVQGEQGPALPAKMGVSILPNPANTVSVNDALLSPEPTNSVFRKYLSEEYDKRKLLAQFVDTFDYAHMNGGNLHCATHTIHICKPETKP